MIRFLSRRMCTDPVVSQPYRRSCLTVSIRIHLSRKLALLRHPHRGHRIAPSSCRHSSNNRQQPTKQSASYCFIGPLPKWPDPTYAMNHCTGPTFDSIRPSNPYVVITPPSINGYEHSLTLPLFTMATIWAGDDMFVLSELYSMLTARAAIRYESPKLLELITLPTVLSLWLSLRQQTQNKPKL